ncbi:OLC1v1032961C1 [Oldenlandia corymbosa var. corymbosa]|uniref:OLC1v1032961C1 n=1 Tax=Oldenlandia corymbosa var. corymbosa TaxID=529605 RepID=A0AAV1CN00_OLDCO|nr:OLC1v1032961C1 [Oldenlandia corymbosa var. corymbosa]
MNFGGAGGIEGNDEPSALQKHVMFFDSNNDGFIYPWETFKGFRAIGCGILLSGFAAIFIHLSLSSKTRSDKGFTLRFPIEVKNIKKAKHGSDSGVYDTQGRFVATKFEQMFKQHAHTNPNALTAQELNELLKANRQPKDFGGWIAAYIEWKILYKVGKDKQGLLPKETVKAVYDGSLFGKMAKEKALSTTY